LIQAARRHVISGQLFLRLRRISYGHPTRFGSGACKSYVRRAKRRTKRQKDRKTI
jgi:hypothetical protein